MWVCTEGWAASDLLQGGLVHAVVRRLGATCARRRARPCSCEWGSCEADGGRRGQVVGSGGAGAARTTTIITTTIAIITSTTNTPETLPKATTTTSKTRTHLDELGSVVVLLLDSRPLAGLQLRHLLAHCLRVGVATSVLSAVYICVYGDIQVGIQQCGHATYESDQPYLQARAGAQGCVLRQGWGAAWRCLAHRHS